MAKTPVPQTMEEHDAIRAAIYADVELHRFENPKSKHIIKKVREKIQEIEQPPVVREDKSPKHW